jgi:hypothetical protein
MDKTIMKQLELVLGGEYKELEVIQAEEGRDFLFQCRKGEGDYSIYRISEGSFNDVLNYDFSSLSYAGAKTKFKK